MKCPYCASDEIRVVDKRESGDETIRRRRECNDCDKRFTSYETVETIDLTVEKRDGTEEDFSRDKLVRGIETATEKRPISQEEVESVADEIERSLRRKEETRVKSEVIGRMVLQRLKDLDEVAYIRFASVYESFEDAEAFKKELAKI